MKKHPRKIVALVSVLSVLALAGFVATRYSLIVVRNQSGVEAANVRVVAEAFQLEAGRLADGDSRWFVRRASGNCGIRIEAQRPQPTSNVAGLIIDARHGYVLTLSLAREGRVQARCFPAADALTPFDVVVN